MVLVLLFEFAVAAFEVVEESVVGEQELVFLFGGVGVQLLLLVRVGRQVECFGVLLQCLACFVSGYGRVSHLLAFIVFLLLGTVRMVPFDVLCFDDFPDALVVLGLVVAETLVGLAGTGGFTGLKLRELEVQFFVAAFERFDVQF